MILIYFNFKIKTILKLNWNNYVLIKILFQKKTNIVWFVFVFLNIFVGKMQLRNLRKKIIDNYLFFQKITIKIAINQQINQNSYQSQIFEIFRNDQKINSMINLINKIFYLFWFCNFLSDKNIHAKINLLTKRSNDKSIFKNDDRQKHQLQMILTSNKLNVHIKKIETNYIVERWCISKCACREPK